MKQRATRLVAAMLATLSASVFIALALPNRKYLAFGVGNGSFQIFDTTRRYLAGELPDAGFQPYLGVGVTMFHAFVTWLVGGNFAANQFMSSFVPPIVVLGYVTLMLRLIPVPFEVKLLAWWAAFVLILAKLLRLPLTPYEISLPDGFLGL